MENITSLGKHLLEEYDDHLATQQMGGSRKHMLLAYRKHVAQYRTGTTRHNNPPETSTREILQIYVSSVSCILIRKTMGCNNFPFISRLRVCCPDVPFVGCPDFPFVGCPDVPSVSCPELHPWVVLVFHPFVVLMFHP